MGNENIKPNCKSNFAREIFTFLSNHWGKIILTSMIFSGLGLSMATLSPTQYQSTANIQIGMVANNEIETPNALIEKLKMPTFYSDTTLKACNTVDANNLISKLKPIIKNSTSFIQISHKDTSFNITKQCLESIIFIDIRNNQKALYKQKIELKKNQLKYLAKSFESKLKIKGRISNIIENNEDYANSKIISNDLILAFLLASDRRDFDLVKEIIELESELLEPATKETFLITPIYSPKDPIDKNKKFIAIVSAILGALSMIIFLIIQSERENMRINN